ncbi:hypothetical protein NPIL_530161 [Nephila pilipes]|uniref:Uncharacterized protein n=1 Tax=Nephila pilipes TaxID=299642 RepID=A0A8X6MQX7_NEPPI|nr:hypothetical protein NPIL_530161 [Nephila pilipes]
MYINSPSISVFGGGGKIDVRSDKKEAKERGGAGKTEKCEGDYGLVIRHPIICVKTAKLKLNLPLTKPAIYQTSRRENNDKSFKASASPIPFNVLLPKTAHGQISFTEAFPVMTNSQHSFSKPILIRTHILENFSPCPHQSGMVRYGAPRMRRRKGKKGGRSSLINIHGILESSLMLATVNLHDNTCSANAQNVRRSLPTEKRQNLKLELITAARKTSTTPFPPEV